jgi:hypothetical protein
MLINKKLAYKNVTLNLINLWDEWFAKLSLPSWLSAL